MAIEKKNICISRIKYTYNESWYKFFATFCFDLSKLCNNETGPRFHVAEKKRTFCHICSDFLWFYWNLKVHLTCHLDT